MRREQRHLDRQRRANNPDNYLPDGHVKKGRRGRKHWQVSQRQRTTQARLANRQRRHAAHRKSLHGHLAHQIVRQCSTFLLEKVSYRAWAALQWPLHPPSCVGDVCDNPDPSGCECWRADHHRSDTTNETLPDLSVWGPEEKTAVSEGPATAKQCGVEMQQDPSSQPPLIRFVDPNTFLLHADYAVEAWPGVESLLRAAWQQAFPTTQPARGGATAAPTMSARGGRLQVKASVEGRPQQAHRPTPRARMLYQHVCESRVAEAVVWARTSRIAL